MGNGQVKLICKNSVVHFTGHFFFIFSLCFQNRNDYDYCYYFRYFGDWRMFSWFLYGQIGLVAFVPLILPESCRWLLANGKPEKCIKILKRIAKMNKKEVYILHLFKVL